MEASEVSKCTQVQYILTIRNAESLRIEGSSVLDAGKSTSLCFFMLVRVDASGDSLILLYKHQNHCNHWSAVCVYEAIVGAWNFGFKPCALKSTAGYSWLEEFAHDFWLFQVQEPQKLPIVGRQRYQIQMQEMQRTPVWTGRE